MGGRTAGNFEFVFLLEIRRGATVRSFLHDPVLRAAGVGLPELHASSIRRKGSAEILEGARIVLQLPGHGTIRFCFVSSRHWVPQDGLARRTAD
jgi:hypothetical protein